MDIKKGVTSILALVIFSAVGVARAQDEPKKTTHMKSRTLTGCLQKGDDANEYKLTSDTGSWDVKSDSVQLAPHVGHTVSVTGVVSNAKMHGAKEDVKDEAKEHGMAKGAKETGDLTATNLKMVSKSCKE
jgi:hypothetical protein